MYYVYHICDHSNTKHGYIGVTNDPERRWNNHIKSNTRVGRSIRKHGWTIDNNMKIIYTGSDSECFLLEQTLRPHPNIGLNIAVGGQGGNTGNYSLERNKKISSTHKGKIKTKKHIQAIMENRGSYKGKANPNAKAWKLTSPSGESHIIIGNLQNTCDTFGIISSTLRKNLGESVPPIQSGGCGGFRAKNKEHLKKRHKTTGWKLERI
jgi:hypothetical protein